MVPPGYILVRYTRRQIEHDDGTVALDIVSLVKRSETFYTFWFPHVDGEFPFVGAECEAFPFESDRADMSGFEFSGQEAMDKRRLSTTSVPNEHQLIFSLRRRLRLWHGRHFGWFSTISNRRWIRSIHTGLGQALFTRCCERSTFPVHSFAATGSLYQFQSGVRQLILGLCSLLVSVCLSHSLP